MPTTLLTIGTFDTPHIGHAAFLRRCERFGDEVIVGVNSDAFVRSYKLVEPVYTQDERRALIGNLGYQTCLNDGPGFDLIEEIGPDVLAISSDWAERNYHQQIATPQSWLDAHGVTLVFIPHTFGISTTDLRARLGR